MVIKISGLKEGEHYYEFEDKIEELELEEPFFGKYSLNIKLQKFHNQIILDAGLKTRTKFECDRCGVSYNTELRSNFQMVYLFGEPEGDSSENTVYLSPDADKINLLRELRDYAILSIPMKKLCSEDCKGLCYRCGKNLNDGVCGCEEQKSDPRWQPLVELKKKMNFN